MSAAFRQTKAYKAALFIYEEYWSEKNENELNDFATEVFEIMLAGKITDERYRNIFLTTATKSKKVRRHESVMKLK